MASRSIYKSIISSIFSIVITVGMVYAVIVVDGTIIFIILSVLTLLIIGGVYISYSKSSYKEKELEKVIRENVLRYAGWELPQFSMGGWDIYRGRDINMINIDFQQDFQSIKERLEALCNSRPNWIKLKENKHYFYEKSFLYYLCLYLVYVDRNILG